MTPTTPAEGLDGLLGRLPSGWAIAHRDDARLVVGPTGAFVLVPHHSDVATSADLAHDLAQRTRVALARHLSWVPFVDAAVVTTRDRHAEVAAVLVPLDLLNELLVQGPVVIEASVVRTVSQLVATGALEGWTVGIAMDDVKIDLCDPPLQPSTTALP